MGPLLELAKQLGRQLKQKGLLLVTAESCTGGGIAELVTRVSGSSEWFDRGFVTYSNEAKHQSLGVKRKTIEQYGAVSSEVSIEMALGAIKNSSSDVSVAVTGVAGPDGGTPEKPVGTVWIAWCIRGQDPISRRFLFRGDRLAVRQQAVECALQGFLQLNLPTKQALSEPQKNYFYALWPDNVVRDQIYKISNQLPLSEGAKMHHKEDLHMTLAFLGTDISLSEKTKHLAAEINFEKFTITLDKLGCWSQSGILYMTVKDIPIPLSELHKSINQKFSQCGYQPDKRDFIPHVTLARKVTSIPENFEFSPIEWHIDTLCLAQSAPAQVPNKYEVLESWSGGRF